MSTKRLIVFALAAPVAVWLGMIVIGGKKGDAAGTALWTGRGFVLPVQKGVLIEAMAAGALVAYLTAKAG